MVYKIKGLEEVLAICENEGFDKEEVVSRITGNSLGVTPISTATVTTSDRLNGIYEKGSPDLTSNIAQYYGAKYSNYLKMIKNFKDELIKRVLFDYTKDTSFKNPNARVGRINLINDAVLTYKKELLSNIKSAFAALDINVDFNADNNIICEQVDKILYYFWNNKHAIKDETLLQKALDSYIILKNFDELLKTYVPFIEVDVRFKNKKSYFSPKYNYVPVSAKHYTGFSNNEYSSAEETTGETVKLLLNYFPEVVGNKIIPGSFIGVSGFDSVMQSVKKWLYLPENQRAFADELAKGVNIDLNRIIKAYLNSNAREIPMFEGKLNSIARIIFGKNKEGVFILPQELRNIFANRFLKYVSTEYMEYKVGESNDCIPSHLKERINITSKYNLEDAIKGSILYWSRNKEVFDTLVNENVLSSGSDFSGLFQTITGIVLRPDFTTIAKKFGITDVNAMLANFLRHIMDTTNKLVIKKISQFDIIKKYDSSQYGSINDFSKVLAHIEQTSFKAVIRNAEGNNLPLQQLPCLAYLHREMKQRIVKEDSNSFGGGNIVFENIDRVLDPVIKTSITFNDKTKSLTKCNTSELTHVALVQDFLYNLLNENAIVLQPHCFADKSKFFGMRYDINQAWQFAGEDVNFYNLFINGLKGDTKAINELKSVFRKTMYVQYWHMSNAVIEDYNKVFDQDFKTLNEIEEIFKKYDINYIRNAFKEKDINFIEELHYSKINNNYTINKTLEKLLNDFSDDKLFETFFNTQYQQFKNDLRDSWQTIGFDKTVIDAVYEFNKSRPKDKKIISTKKHNVKHFDPMEQRELISETEDEFVSINSPVPLIYFLAHNIFSNNFNRLMFGDSFLHPNKEKSDDFYEGMASRWIAQTKRLAIAGATYHTYAPNVEGGVEDEVIIAVMEDVKANVRNVIGNTDDIDSCDGSGFTAPIASRQANTSLLEARAGRNKKTIFADIDPKTGTPTLLKWAEYEITNEKRRNSKYGINLENLIKRMYSLNISFDVLKNLSQVRYGFMSKPIYFEDINGEYYKIENIYFDVDEVTQKVYAVRTLTAMTNAGLKTNETITKRIPIENVYDIDQLFGGAYSGEFKNGKWVFTEDNQDEIYKTVVKAKLTKGFVSHLVNKSAIKVGARNINLESAWTDNSELWTTTVSTRFGGVQMDADHTIDETESTEPTQMITALIQGGFSTNTVSRVYEKLTSLILNSIKDYTAALEKDDKDKLYALVKKSIIKAFTIGDKDEIGLAQSFIAFAQSDAAAEGYKIPFSASTINDIFTSTVMSDFTKNSIRRKYNGLGGVLNPSYGIMQYYQINGQYMTYTEAYEKLRRMGYTQNINDLFEKVIIDGNLNPTIIPLQAGEQIDFEDTIVVRNRPKAEQVNVNVETDGTVHYYVGNEEIDESEVDLENLVRYVRVDGNIVYESTINNGLETTEEFEYTKISNIEDYWKFRHRADLGEVYIWTARPRDLKGLDCVYKTMNMEIGVDTFSTYDAVESQLLHFVEKYKKLLKNGLTEESLNELLEKVNIDLQELFGNESNYKVNLISNKLNEFKVVLSKHLNKSLSNLKKNLKDDLQTFQNSLKRGNTIIKQVWINDSFVKIPCVITEATVKPAQIIAGRINAKEFGLQEGDTISDIKEKGSQFFRERLAGRYVDSNVDKDSYDFILFDGAGKQLYVTFRQPFDRSKLALNDDYKNIENAGTIFDGDREICSAENKQFYKYTDANGTVHDLVVLDSENWRTQLNELRDTYKWSHLRKNFNTTNLEQLWDWTTSNELTEEKLNGNSPTLFFYDESNKISRKNMGANYLTGFDRMDENARNNWIKKLNDDQIIRQGYFFDKHSKKMYNAFLDSLQFVGTRIPCQSMQSFAPMEIIAFSDSETNEVYLPTHITWIEGSDYDIDKQYIIGFDPTSDGRLLLDYTGSNYNLQTQSLKNIIIESILSVTKDPKNFINLTTPISTDSVKTLAEKSKRGEESKTMSPFNPIGIFKLQVENSIGKSAIGVAATGTKSFFILSYCFNNGFHAIYNCIKSGEYLTAASLLKQYTLGEDETHTLANVNLSNFTEEFLQSIPDEFSDLKEKLKKIVENNKKQGDAALGMGELLNAATDNAKNLFLKKINADTNWMDIYIYNLAIGRSIENVFEVMDDPIINEFIRYYEQNIFEVDYKSTNKIKAFTKFKKHVLSKRNDLTEEQLKRVDKFGKWLANAELYQLIGKLASINQGLPTKKYEIVNFVKTVNEKVGELIGERFDLISFITDNDYAATMESVMDQNKTLFNILTILRVVPHIKAMWYSFATAYLTIKDLSVRNDVHINQALKQGFKSEEDFITLITNIDQRLDIKWLESLDFNFVIPGDLISKLYGKTNNDQKVYIKNDIKSPKLFKDYMEYYVIPKLRQDNPDNIFLKSLRFGIDRNTNQPYFRLPINMMEVDRNAYARQLFEEISNDFNELGKLTFDGHNVIDLFYVYNLFTNKSFSQSSMLRLFSDQVTIHNKGAFVVEHAQWLDSQNPETVLDDTAPRLEPVVTSETENRSYYQRDLSNNILLNEILNNDDLYKGHFNIINSQNIYKVMSKYGLTKEDVDNSHLLHANAFVFNGDVFINTDNATDADVVHEFAHIWIAIQKSSENEEERARLKQVLEEIQLHPLYKSLRTNPTYNLLREGDFAEEVLATLIGNDISYLHKITDVFKDSKDPVTDFVNTMLSKERISRKYMANQFAEKARIAQKVVNERNRLIENKWIKEDCN